MFPTRSIRKVSLAVILVVLALLVAAGGAAAPVARAGGGHVLPPTARPKGYSLTRAAAVTAFFNTGLRTPETLPSDFPFQILFAKPGENSNTITAKSGTMFYVPIAYSDNSAPILGDFPNVNDPAAVADYYFSPQQLGAEIIEVVIDGDVTTLGPQYMVGAEVPTLVTGGDRYTTAAVFLTPLPKGTHTVIIHPRFTGAALEAFPDYFPGGVFEFATTYTVIVR